MGQSASISQPIGKPEVSLKVVDSRDATDFWILDHFDTRAITKAKLSPDMSKRYSIVFNYSIQADGRVADLEVLAVNPPGADTAFQLVTRRAAVYRPVDAKNPTPIRVMYATSAAGKDGKETIKWATAHADSLRRRDAE